VLLLLLLLKTASPSFGEAPPSWHPSPEDCRALCREGENGKTSEKFGTTVCYSQYCLVTHRHYEKSSAPSNREGKVAKQSPLVVQTKVHINTVSDIIMSEQLVSANMKVLLAWEDPGLDACCCSNKEGVDETDNGGEFTLGADVEDLIWVPDLATWNYRKFERETGMGRKNYAYTFFSNISKNNMAGLMVEFEVDIYTTVSCDFDVSNFPYDVNFCFIRLGSYLHSREEVIFNTTEVAVQDGQKLRTREFRSELLPLPDSKSFDKYEDEIKSLFGFSIKIERDGARVESQYTKMMGSIIFLVLSSFFIDVIDDNNRDPNMVDRGGLLGGGILCTVLVFQYTVRFTPTMEELILNPVVRYNLLCLLVCVLCMMQWCLLGSNRLVSYIYKFCVPSFLRVSGKKDSKADQQMTSDGKSTSEGKFTSDGISASEGESSPEAESTSERKPTSVGDSISEEELKRARVICDSVCFVFLAIGFYSFSYFIFRM